MLCFLEASFPGSLSNLCGGHFFSCISEDRLLWSIYFNCSILEVFPAWSTLFPLHHLGFSLSYLALLICLEMSVPLRGSWSWLLSWQDLVLETFNSLGVSSWTDQIISCLASGPQRERCVLVSAQHTWLSVSALDLTAPVDGVYQCYSLLPHGPVL